MLTALLLAPLAAFAQARPAATTSSPIEEIYPVKVDYPEAPFAALKAVGPWTEINGQLASSGQCYESIGPTNPPTNPSALKSVIAETAFTFKDAETKGAAGLQFGFSKRLKREFGDEVHPNAKGARLMAEFLCGQVDMRKMLDALKPRNPPHSLHHQPDGTTYRITRRDSRAWMRPFTF
jgi:hypothetical protein